MVLAEITVGNILNAERAARLVEQHALDPSLPGLEVVIDGLLEGTFGIRPSNSYETEVSRAVERVVVEGLTSLAARASMPQARAIASLRLREINGRLASGEGGETTDQAHYAMLATDIERFLTRPADPFERPDTPDAPPGAPIGDPALNWMDGSAFWCSEWPQ